MCRFSRNPFKTDNPLWTQDEYAAFGSDDIHPFHQSIPGYAPTPLTQLPGLARKLGVKTVLVKDESHRFDLGAFKIMGASYAIYRVMKEQWESKFGVQFEVENLYQPGLVDQFGLPPFAAATDGNHGRAVAWFARVLGHRAIIYMPRGTVAARIDNIRKLGARVEVIDGEYDEAVKKISEDADANGWQIISDMSWPGYTRITGRVMAGYTTMFREVDQSLTSLDTEYPTHIFIQSGAGSFAGAAAWYYHSVHRAEQPKLISIEPTRSDCLLESALTGNGDRSPSRGDQDSIMAGLNCRTPSLIGWPLIRDRFEMFVSIPDDYSILAMRQYYFPEGRDPRIISGESGAAGLGGLMALQEKEALADAKVSLGLDRDSVILLFNTEGNTDPEHFSAVVGQKSG